MGSFRCSSVRPSIHPSVRPPPIHWQSSMATARDSIRVFCLRRRPCRSFNHHHDELLAGAFGFGVSVRLWWLPVSCAVPCPTNQPTTRVEFPCPIGGGRRRWTSSLPKWRHTPESMFVCHCYTQKQNHINTTRQTESKIFCYFFIFFLNCNLEN